MIQGFESLDGGEKFLSIRLWSCANDDLLCCLGYREEFYFYKLVLKEALLVSDVSHIEINIVLLLKSLKKLQSEK